MPRHFFDIAENVHDSAPKARFRKNLHKLSLANAVICYGLLRYDLLEESVDLRVPRNDPLGTQQVPKRSDLNRPPFLRV